MRTALIVNPHSGSGRGARRGQEAMLALQDCTVITPRSAEHVNGSVHRAVQDGARAIIACGGDGTVHQVLQAVMSLQVPDICLGIVPAGSGDDIARELGMTGDDALTRLRRALDEGRTRTVDVARVTSSAGQRWALGVISCGFDSAVNERANAMTRVRGKARYLVGIVAELGSFRPVEYSMSIDDGSVRAPGILVAVGNGGSYGGGMRICPDARMDDGLLSVTWLNGLSRTSLVRLFPRIYSGAHVNHASVTTYEGRRIHIDAPGQLAYADGERVGPLPISIEAVPSSLSVLDSRVRAA